MLIGRDYRKFISQAVAYGAFRFLTIWLIVAMCASEGKLGIAVGLVVAAVELISEGSTKFTRLLIDEKSRGDWKDRLTDRCFYSLLFEEIRIGNGSRIDIDELFKLASAEALVDIKRADNESAEEAGILDKTAWHWFGGALSFLWRCASFYLYYRSAIYVGSGGRM
jgi:hypothetical protein